MIGRTNTGGGGCGAYAFIIAAYPEGSTCTAFNGSKTLRAKDTSGSYVFKIPYAGTWTVSCTDGSQTASATVSITSEGQSESVSLSYLVPSEYQQVEYIESTGTQYIITGIAPSEVRGGAFSFVKTADVNYSFLWGAGSNPSSVDNALGFRISSGGAQAGLWYGGNTVDLSATVNTNTEYDVAFSCSSGAQELEINGITSSASRSANPTNAYPITLFTFHYANTVKTAENCKARLKHIEFYDVNNAKNYDVYPCYRKSDSVAGVWDRVSNTFQTNSGSDSFVVGPDV